MNAPFSIDAPAALHWSLWFLAILAAQVSLESFYNHKLYSDGHLLSWKVHRRQKEHASGSSFKEIFLDFVFKYPNFLFLNGIKLLLALAFLFSWENNNNIIYWIIPFLITNILTGMRNLHVNNGSDQLANMILISISIIYLTGNTSFIRNISLFFIACQGALAYLTSGFFKLIVPNWMNGSYLEQVLCTRTFGHRYLKACMDHWKPGYRILSLMMICWELLMGVAFLFPPGICLAILAGGVAFHLSVAIVMGFNTFLWAFLAVYPPIYLISLKIH
jgi:hypothetical protein